MKSLFAWITNVLKKKWATIEKFLEELNFFLGFKFQEVNKIECAFESLLCDFWF